MKEKIDAKIRELEAALQQNNALLNILLNSAALQGRLEELKYVRQLLEVEDASDREP